MVALKKAVEHATVFGTLGLQVDLSRVGEQQILVDHTDKRKEELLVSLTEIVEAGRLESRAFERLRRLGRPSLKGTVF